jgi:hypothetical protein
VSTEAAHRGPVQSPRTATVEREESAPRPAPARDRDPVFVAGPDRSGTTLMFALLGSHPNISMVRRTNMWKYFHRRYGDLADPNNFDRCLGDMVRYRRMRRLEPNEDRIRREFRRGDPTYGHLFALFHEHNAERAGKPRWGDKSLHTEHHATQVFDEFPEARIVHMFRDPRDRYASTISRHGRDVHRVGAATARWLLSARVGLRNVDRYPGRYMVARYEDLVTEPEGTMRGVCEFIGEPYEPVMFSMESSPEHRDAGGNSSFGDMKPGAISTQGIGRFRTAVSPMELRFIELTAGPQMTAVGYERVGATLSRVTRLRFFGWYLPVNLVRMVGWIVVARVRFRRGRRLPPSRLTEEPRPEAAGES